jgi:hypothetical protein
LAGINDPGALGPEQQRYIEAMAFGAARTLRALRDTVKERIIVENADEAKRVLAYLWRVLETRH